jgi:hypothetical protein
MAASEDSELGRELPFGSWVKAIAAPINGNSFILTGV